MTLIEGRENILRFQLLSRLMALRVQRDTGLRHSRGSVVAVCRRDYGIKARRIADAITELEAIVDSDQSIEELVAKNRGERA